MPSGNRLNLTAASLIYFYTGGGFGLTVCHPPRDRQTERLIPGGELPSPNCLPRTETSGRPGASRRNPMVKTARLVGSGEAIASPSHVYLRHIIHRLQAELTNRIVCRRATARAIRMRETILSAAERGHDETVSRLTLGANTIRFSRAAQAALLRGERVTDGIAPTEGCTKISSAAAAERGNKSLRRQVAASAARTTSGREGRCVPPAPIAMLIICGLGY